MKKFLLSLSIATFAFAPQTHAQDAAPLDNTAEVRAFYGARPEFFVFAKPSDLPANLEWNDGTAIPEFANLNAVRGGTVQGAIDDYPRTFRIVGPDSNGSFRGYILDDNELSLVALQPNTGDFYPQLAEAFAISKDTKTIYFRLHKDARWSDGPAVTSDDFFFTFFFYLSSYIDAPWYNDWYTKNYERITRYDERTFAITLKKSRPDMLAVANLSATPQHFYKELGPDFSKRYQWRVAPTTGPYTIDTKLIKRGESITLVRVKDWWASEKKWMRGRYNPERIRLTVVRDTDKVFELFRSGKVDSFNLTLPKYWYEKLADDDALVRGGYVHKVVFYNEVPRAPYGLWINTAKPLLDNRDIRLGINYAANFQLLCEKYFRGDFSRLNTTSDGYGNMSHPTLRARPFDVEKALEHFARAGFSKRGPDGILVNDAGQKLSFTVTTGYDNLVDALIILKDEAKKAGLDLQIEKLEGTAAWKKIQEKNHEIAFSAFGYSVEMYPRFWETFHSINAYDSAFLADGSVNPNRKPKTQSNNLCNLANAKIDALIDQYDRSESLDEMRGLMIQIEELIADEACFVPGFAQTFYRVGFWRWVIWPDDFNVRLSEGAGHYRLSYIDSEMKKVTLEAREAGTTFAPRIAVFDQFKQNKNAEQK